MEKLTGTIPDLLPMRAAGITSKKASLILVLMGFINIMAVGIIFRMEGSTGTTAI